MAQIDVKKNLIQGKIVYYGPGLCGKTTNLEYINRSVKGTKEMVSLATQGDRTIFFDFLPMELGQIRGINTAFKLYTVPGQVRYNLTRKMVLKNADGVVFVADSQRLMADSNLESLENLFANLSELKADVDNIPVVLQYNKRDLPDLLTREQLDKALNGKGYPVFLASAMTGDGVVETLAKISSLVFEKISAEFGGDASGGEGARARRPKRTTKPGLPAQKAEQPAAAEPAAANQPLAPKPVPAAPEPQPQTALKQAPTQKVAAAEAGGAGQQEAVAGVEEMAAALTPWLESVKQLLSKQNERMLKILENSLNKVDETVSVGVKKTVEDAVSASARKAGGGPAPSELKKAVAEAVAATAGKPGGEAVTPDLKKVVEEAVAAALKNEMAELDKRLGAPGKAAAGDPGDRTQLLKDLKAEFPTKKDLADLRSQMAKLAVDSSVQLKTGLPTKKDVDDLRSTITGLSAGGKGAPAGKEAPAVSPPDLDELKKQMAALSKSLKEGLEVKSSLADLQKDISELLCQTEARVVDVQRSVRDAVDELREAIIRPIRQTVQPGAPEAIPTEKEATEEKAEVKPETPPEAEKSAEEPAEPEEEKPAEEAEQKSAEDKPAEEPAEEKAAEAEPAEMRAEPEEEKAADAEPAGDNPEEKAEEEAAEEKAEEERAEEERAEEEKAEEEKAEEPAEAAEKEQKKEEEDFSSDPRHKNAARIARVMVADLSLYYSADVTEGIKAGDIDERLKNQFDEMRKTFAARVPEEVREKKDHLQEAIDNFIEKKSKDIAVG